jgi:hypothetical protein
MRNQHLGGDQDSWHLAEIVWHGPECLLGDDHRVSFPDTTSTKLQLIEKILLLTRPAEKVAGKLLPFSNDLLL